MGWGCVVSAYNFGSLGPGFKSRRYGILLMTAGRFITNISLHYENTPIQIYRNFHLQKLKTFRYKNSDIFHMSAQNIDCGYSLEPPR